MITDDPDTPMDQLIKIYVAEKPNAHLLDKNL
jgi:hypothetical protein